VEVRRHVSQRRQIASDVVHFEVLTLVPFSEVVDLS